MDTEPGRIAWTNLTVDDAERVRDFYAAVAGWSAEPLSMGDYDDFVMKAADGTPVAGVCHARGPNAAIPPQWLIYVNVADLDHAVAEVERNGGALVTPVREMGNYRMVVVRDPAGAVLALGETTGE